MSILPAEAFFAKSVFLVEGPSEQLFYTELAKALEIDLDYYNISILSVDGVQFKVYASILNAMEIPGQSEQITTSRTSRKTRSRTRTWLVLTGV